MFVLFIDCFRVTTPYIKEYVTKVGFCLSKELRTYVVYKYKYDNARCILLY